MAVVQGTINVPTAGTRVQAASAGPVRSLIFKARHGNIGDCYIGGSTVSSASGLTLAPGEALPMTFRDPIQTSQFWADAANNNDKIDFLGLE